MSGSAIPPPSPYINSANPNGESMEIDEGVLEDPPPSYSQLFYPPSIFQNFLDTLVIHRRILIDPHLLDRASRSCDLEEPVAYANATPLDRINLQDLDLNSLESWSASSLTTLTVRSSRLQPKATTQRATSKISVPNTPTPATLGWTFATGSNLIPLGRPIRPLGWTMQRGYNRSPKIIFPPPQAMLPLLPHPPVPPVTRNSTFLPRRPPPPLHILPGAPPHSSLTSTARPDKSKRYPPYSQGKVPLTKEQVLANEKTAQVRAAIKRGMTLMSYRFFRAVGPVTIDPTTGLQHGATYSSLSLDLVEDLISLPSREGPEDFSWMVDILQEGVAEILPIFDSEREAKSTDRSNFLRKDCQPCLLD